MRAMNNIVAFLLVFIAINTVMTLSLPAQEAENVERGMRVYKDVAQSNGLTQGTRWALLVGISDYPPSEIFEVSKLVAPVNDVNNLEGFLKDPGRGGFAQDKVLILKDEKATQRAILDSLDNISTRAAPEDMVIFYFSGHGYCPGDRNTTYLLPYDYNLEHPQNYCINFESITTNIENMKANKVIVILDACHSGGIRPKGAKNIEQGRMGKNYDEVFQSAEGRYLLLSSGENEVSWEEEGNGVFTKFLLEGLRGGADRDNDGIVTFTEAALHVEKAVPEYTRGRFSRIQNPVRRGYSNPIRGDIPLAINLQMMHRNQQVELKDKRTQVILMAGLETVIKEFSLSIIESVYNKVSSGESVTQKELALIPEIDALQAGKITRETYFNRAQAINKIGLAQLQVRTTPPGSAIILARADKPGSAIPPSSPNIYQVEPGRYLLSAKPPPGYASYSREIAISQSNDAITIELERLMGTLNLQMEPSDANIRITPINVPAPDVEITESKASYRLPIGKYRVLAGKTGYYSAVEEPVEILANGQILITLRLIPKDGAPVVTSIPKPDRRPNSVLRALIWPLPDRKVTGILVVAVELGILTVSAVAHFDYTSKLDDYKSAREKYSNIANFSTYQEYESQREDMLSKYNRAQNSSLQRKKFLIPASTVVGIRIIGILGSTIFASNNGNSRGTLSSTKDGIILMSWKHKL